MLKKLKNNKAFSITELSIVIAVLMIVITMVMSFCTFLSYRAKVSLQDLRFQNDVNTVQDAVGYFQNQFDSSDYKIKADERAIVCAYSASDNSKVASLTFTGKKVIVDYTDPLREDRSFTLTEATKIDFYVVENKDADKIMLQYEVFYDQINSGGQGTTTESGLFMFKTFYAAKAY